MSEGTIQTLKKHLGINFLEALSSKHGLPFITFMFFQYVNHGMWVMVILGAQNLYKQYMMLEPDEMAFYISIIHLPWTIKIFYGIMSDNVPIFGYFRKSYLILMGLLQFVTLLSIYKGELYNEPLRFTILLTVANFSEAVVNVVTDAILCIEARKDKENGSKNLFSVVWVSSALGGIAGGLLGGYFTEYSHPKYIFCMYSVMGLFISLLGANITEKD